MNNIFAMPAAPAGDAAETEERRHQGDDEEHNCIMKHERTFQLREHESLCDACLRYGDKDRQSVRGPGAP